MQVFYDLGIANTLYWSCYVLGFLAIFVFNSVYGKHYHIAPGKAFLFTFVSYILIYAWTYVLAWVVNGFTWGHHNAIRVYIWFPLVLFVTCKIFRLDWKMSCEFMAPSTCIVYGIARLGCNFTGCCYGIPARWGIYSVQAGGSVFPVQLCESVTALLIAFYLIYLAKKRNYQPTGTLYPIMLVLYGGTRFLWEFLADNQKLFLGISELALWALATFIIGLAWLFARNEINQKKSSKTQRS